MWYTDSEGICEVRWSVKDSRQFIIHSVLCLHRSRPVFTVCVTLSPLLRDCLVGIVMPQGLCTYDLPLPVTLFSEPAAPSASSGFRPNMSYHRGLSALTYSTWILAIYSFLFKEHITSWHIFSELPMKLAHGASLGLETHSICCVNRYTLPSPYHHYSLCN